jgi:hypothetical protein
MRLVVNESAQEAMQESDYHHVDRMILVIPSRGIAS